MIGEVTCVVLQISYFEKLRHELCRDLCQDPGRVPADEEDTIIQITSQDEHYEVGLQGQENLNLKSG